MTVEVTTEVEVILNDYSLTIGKLRCRWTPMHLTSNAETLAARRLSVWGTVPTLISSTEEMKAEFCEFIGPAVVFIDHLQKTSLYRHALC